MKAKPDLPLSVYDTLIAKSGLKKKYIAKRIGVVPNHLYQFLRGNRNLSQPKLDALISLLNEVTL